MTLDFNLVELRELENACWWAMMADAGTPQQRRRWNMHMNRLRNLRHAELNRRKAERKLVTRPHSQGMEK